MKEIIVEKRRQPPIVLRLVINAVALYLTAGLVGGVEVSGFFGALLAAVVLTLVNTFVRPLLIILTLPVTIFTLGLFIFIVNGVSLLLAAAISGGAFQIHGVGPAVIAWLVFALINWAITSLFKRRQVTVIER